jgi:hypothetical protein
VPGRAALVAAASRAAGVRGTLKFFIPVAIPVREAGLLVIMIPITWVFISVEKPGEETLEASLHFG